MSEEERGGKGEGLVNGTRRIQVYSMYSGKPWRTCKYERGMPSFYCVKCTSFSVKFLI